MGDDSVSKFLAGQAWGTEFRSPEAHVKIWVRPQQFVSVNLDAREEMEGDSLGLLDQQVGKKGFAQVQEETLSQKIW